MESLAVFAGSAAQVGVAEYLDMLATRADGDERRREVLAVVAAPAAPELAAATGPAPAPAAGGDDLLAMLRQRGRLTRKEVMGLLGVSQSTASVRIRRMVEAGLARRVEPTPAPASHYVVPVGGGAEPMGRSDHRPEER
jgi:CRP-like cAMP-binding protein